MADLTADILDYESWVWSEGHYLDIQFAESEILSQLAGFVRAGIVAKEVRRFRLYKDKFNSFKDWCEGALKRSHWQIKRLIEAARVWIDLAQAGFETLPTCEAQCRPLAKFLPNDLVDQGLLAEKWREVIEVVPPQNLTADRIREALGDPPRRRAISLKPELRKRLSDRAEQHGLTEEQLIEQLLNDLDDGETVEEPVPEAAIAEWQDDLENLVSESGGDEPPHPQDLVSESPFYPTKSGVLTHAEPTILSRNSRISNAGRQGKAAEPHHRACQNIQKI